MARHDEPGGTDRGPGPGGPPSGSPEGRPTGTPPAAHGDDAGHHAGPPPTTIHGDPAHEQTPDPEAARAIEILSHELRSPITTINLGTKVLRFGQQKGVGEARADVIEALEVEAERLYRLIEDLLAVARHEGSGEPLPVRPLLLQRWLPTIISSEAAAMPGVRVRTHIDPAVPPVLVDDAALAHVVRNLLSNAARFGPAGHPVELVVETVECGVGIRVLDRGPGVDPDEAEHLFQPFYRSPRALAAGGAGLGLAAAKRLLRAMGSSIEARPRAGGGAEFIVCLPALSEDEEATG